ncbi:protein sidekick-1-like [Ptychodera flava]|uniref:protein sidekick-1-like n=1 Tax=Ptychodera flava TaxID=63121 RepID=UPI003969C47E
MKYGQFVMQVFQMTIVGGLSLTYSQTLNASTSLTVEVNDTAEIDCEIQQNDDRAMYTAEDITWYNLNQAIPGEMYSTMSNTTSVLVLPFVQFADAGNYSCRLDNGAVSTTEIRVGTLPSIANFSCQAHNMKEVWCTWDPVPSNLPTTYVFTYKPSHEMKWKDCPDSVSKGPNSCYIEQSDGTPHDLRVVATNDLGSKVWLFNIDSDTQSKPDPPEDVKVIAEKSNIAAVSWKIPSEWYSPHFTLLYKLQYYSEWEPYIWSEELDADTQLSYTLTSLDAYTCYTIHVATKSLFSSDEYWSDWSTPSIGCTKEAVPEKALEVNIPGQTLKGGLRNVTIRWQRLTKRQARGEITQYRMTVKDEDDPSKADNIDILDGNATEYTLQGLEVHKSYIVSVIALNTAGPSPQSFIKIVDKTQAPGPPSITEAKNLTESSIYIAWTAPSDPNDIISNYMLSYIGNSGNPQWKTITIDGSVHNYTVGDLLAYVQYEFKIQAKNELGYSEISEAVRLYTKEGAPSAAPRNLTLQSIPSNPMSLQAIWKAPCVEDRNGIILKYKLTVCPSLSNRTCSGQAITTVTYKVSDPQSLKSSREWLSFEISGLQPNSEYAVSASALTAAGEGPATGYVSQRTSIGAPRDVPDDVKLVSSSITDTEMTITWTHVPSYNVTSTGYEVIAVPQNNSLHCRSWTNHTADSTITIKDLCGYETYKVVVRACSDALIADPCGDKSEPVYGRTDIGSPSKPVYVTLVESDSASMLKLEWKLPDRPNGPVESLQYAIFCSVGDQNMTEMMIVHDKLSAEVDIDCGSSHREDVAAKCQVTAFNKNVRDRSQYGIADREQLVCYHAKVWIPIIATIATIIIFLVLVLCLRKAYKFTEKHGAWSKVALPYKAWMDESVESGDMLVNFPEERESYDVLKSEPPRKETDRKGEIDKISCNSDKGMGLKRLPDSVNVSEKNGSNRKESDAAQNIDSDQNSERDDHNDKQELTNPSAVKEDPVDFSEMSEVNGKSLLPLPLKMLTPPSDKAIGEVGDYSMLNDSGGIRLPISSHPKATIDEEIPETVPVVHEDTSDSSIMFLSLSNEDFLSVGFQIPGQEAHENTEMMPLNSSQARQAELDNESPLNSNCKVTESEAGRGNNSVLINQNGPDSGMVNNPSSSLSEYTTLAEFQHSSQTTRNNERPENQAAASRVDLPGTMTSEDRQIDNSASSASRLTQDSVRPTDGYISPPTPPASVLPTATQEGNLRGPVIGPVNSDYVQVELCPEEKLNSGRVSELGPDNSKLSNRSAAEPTAATTMQDSANVFQSNEYLLLETLPKGAVEQNSSSQGVTAGESSSAHSQEYVGQDVHGEIWKLPKLDADSSPPYVTDFASVEMPNNAVKRQDTLQSLQKFSPSDDKNVPLAPNANKSSESGESDHVEVNVSFQPSSLSDVVCFNQVSDQEIDSDEEEIESDESDRLVTTTEMDGYM